MANADSCLTIHMVASLDGFIATPDGSVAWLDPFNEAVAAAGGGDAGYGALPTGSSRARPRARKRPRFCTATDRMNCTAK